MSKGERKVQQIKKAFVALHERDRINEVSIREVKNWLDDNTRDGMTLMRLANFLSKRPSFKMVRRERKVGTNQTESFWTMPDVMVREEYIEARNTARRIGWVTDYGRCFDCREMSSLNADGVCSKCEWKYQTA
tara:strand:- start:111 stop:509 length:399 start_codon:yes stop_codon:yes gene_type:complete